MVEEGGFFRDSAKSNALEEKSEARQTPISVKLRKGKW